MTKYEWERQLKKGISGLPKSEQQRVLDYYNELFADKIDAGMREQYIIAEFGNPYDVANKILVDFYTEGKENAATDEYVYSPADEIDEAFEETPRPRQTVACEPIVTPEPTVTHTVKEEAKTDARLVTNDKRKYIAVETGKKPEENTGKKHPSAMGLVVIICALLFFAVGACFNKWHPAWMIFLLIPIVQTFVVAIRKRNWKYFCYPVLVVFVYLLLGFYCHLWHPMWILFITIPLYYIAGDYVTKNSKPKENANEAVTPAADVTADTPTVKEEAKQTEEIKETETVKSTEKTAKKDKGAPHVIAGILLTVVSVFIMVAMWTTVVSLFTAGIAMIISGVVGFVMGCLNIATAFNSAMIALGGSLIVLGLGLVFTFGFAGLFKVCGKLCKELCGAIGRCFGNKENA